MPVGLIHVAAMENFLDFLHRKGKGKVHPRTGHESPKEE